MPHHTGKDSEGMTQKWSSPDEAMGQLPVFVWLRMRKVCCLTYPKHHGCRWKCGQSWSAWASSQIRLVQGRSESIREVIINVDGLVWLILAILWWWEDHCLYSPHYPDLFNTTFFPFKLCMNLPQLAMLFNASDTDIVLVSSEEDPANKSPVQFKVHQAILTSSTTFKCDLPVVITCLTTILSQPHFLSTTPTQVYAITSWYDIKDLAKLALSYTLSINILNAPLFNNLKFITTYLYHWLLDLHRQCSTTARNLLKVSPPDSVKCIQCNSSTYSAFLHPQWWTESQKRAGEQLAISPTSEVKWFLGWNFYWKWLECVDVGDVRRVFCLDMNFWWSWRQILMLFRRWFELNGSPWTLLDVHSLYNTYITAL